MSAQVLSGVAGVAALLVLLRAVSATTAARQPLAGELAGARLGLPVAAFPTAFSLQAALGGRVTLAALVMVLGSCLLVARGQQYERDRWVLLLLAMSLVPVLIRLEGSSQIRLVGLTLLTAGALSRRYSRAELVRGLYLGHVVFLYASWMALFAGLSSATTSNRTGGLESSFGGSRIIFPFEFSIMTAAYAAAVCVCGLFAGVCFSRFYVQAVVVLPIGLATLVAADSRTALLLTVVISALLVYAPRLLIATSLPLVAGALTLPVLVDVVQVGYGQVVSSLTELGALPARAGESNATLNGRTLIWSTGLRLWPGLQDTLGTEVFGYGPLGQVSSGVSFHYGRLFAGAYADFNTASLHNAALQQLFDGGLVGLVGLAGATVLGVRRWASAARDPRGVLDRVGFVMLLVMALSAATEVLITPGYTHLGFLVWLLLIAASPGSRRRATAKGRTAPVPLTAAAE